MQVFFSQIVGTPVFSLQHGGQITAVQDLLIDPGALQAVALICKDNRDQRTLLLHQDIRQASPHGIIVDSDDALADIADIVRLQPLLDKPFRPAGTMVVTQMGRRVGRVETYTLKLADWRIEQLHVRRAFWHSPLGASLIIGRAQVVDVQDKQIVVKDTDLPAASPVKQVVPKHS